MVTIPFLLQGNKSCSEDDEEEEIKINSSNLQDPISPVCAERFSPADKAAGGLQGEMGSKTFRHRCLQYTCFVSTVCKTLPVIKEYQKSDTQIMLFTHIRK